MQDFSYEPDRVMKNDFLSDDFSNANLCDRKLKDYDLVHLWAIEKIVFSALPKIISQMKKDAILITGFEQVFFQEDISNYLDKKNIPASVQGYNQGTFFLKRN